MAMNEREIAELAPKAITKWMEDHLLSSLSELIGKYANREIGVSCQSRFTDVANEGDEDDVELTIENKGDIPMTSVRVWVGAANHAAVGLDSSSMDSHLELPVIAEIPPGERRATFLRLRIMESTYNQETNTAEPRSTLRVRVIEWTPSFANLATPGKDVRLLKLTV